MAKWGWVIASIVAMLAGGCTKEKERRSILDTPKPGEVITEPKMFSPEDHFDLGMHYYGGGKLKEAEHQFLMALKDRPDYADAHNGLGYVYHFMGFMEIHANNAREAIELHEKAVSHFQKALEKEPKKVEAYIGLSMVFYDQYQYFTPRKEEYRARALGYLDKAKAIAPQNEVVQANVGFHMAKLYLAERSYRDAAPLLSRVAQCEGVDPMTRVQAHHMLAGCLYMLGDKEGAIEHYRRYIDLFPGAPDADEVRDMIADIQRELLSSAATPGR